MTQDTSKVQKSKISSKRAVLEHVDVDDLLHKRVFTNQYVDSNMSLALETLNFDSNIEMCETSQMGKTERSLLQDGKHEDMC